MFRAVKWVGLGLIVLALGFSVVAEVYLQETNIPVTVIQPGGKFFVEPTWLDELAGKDEGQADPPIVKGP